MESLLANINDSPIVGSELMTVSEEFLHRNPTKAHVIKASTDVYQYLHLYKDKGIIGTYYVMTPGLPYKMDYFIKDRTFIHMINYEKTSTKLFFVMNNRCVFVDNKYNLSFFELLTNNAFFEIIDELMVRPDTDTDFMRDNSSFKEIENVDIHWVTKRHNTKSARGYAVYEPACS